MKTAIGERFSQLIEAEGKTLNAFANSLGKPYSSIKVIVEGTSKPGFELLETVLRTYPNVSRDWLLMGEGPMLRTEQQPQPTEPDGYLKEFLQKMEENFARLSAELASKNQQIAGLQRTVDALLSNRTSASEPSFRKPAFVTGRAVEQSPKIASSPITA